MADVKTYFRGAFQEPYAEHPVYESNLFLFGLAIMSGRLNGNWCGNRLFSCGELTRYSDFLQNI